MRIINGVLGGRVISVPRSFRARPTTDMAREALFNILRSRIEMTGCRVLDLFAGTGIIGFEFASCGAPLVVAVEKDPVHCRSIRENIQTLNIPQVKAVNADVFRILKSPTQTFDLVFADPPFNHPRIAEIPALVMASGCLAPQGIFILEHGPELKTDNMPFFKEIRHYGKVHFSFFGD